MTVKYRPDHCRTVTPYLLAENADSFLEFVQKAFAAKIIEQVSNRNNKTAHCEVMIGDSLIMAGAQPGAIAGDSLLYLYVENMDEVYEKALSAGATSLMALADQFYGDRNAMVQDTQGIKWSIATHIENLNKNELEKRAGEFHSKNQKNANNHYCERKII